MVSIIVIIIFRLYTITFRNAYQLYDNKKIIFKFNATYEISNYVNFQRLFYLLLNTYLYILRRFTCV